jgi:hypothetical protein
MVTGAALDYSDFMDDKNLFFKAGKVGLVLTATFLVTLTGCVSYVDGPHAGIYTEPSMVVVQDDYMYYPAYQMYYGSHSHQWYDREGSSWVARPAPREVSVDVLHASPSVKMDFHDSPANHHTMVVKQYPKNWKASGSNQAQKQNQKDDRHDQHDGNNGS